MAPQKLHGHALPCLFEVCSISVHSQATGGILVLLWASGAFLKGPSVPGTDGVGGMYARSVHLPMQVSLCRRRVHTFCNLGTRTPSATLARALMGRVPSPACCVGEHLRTTCKCCAEEQLHTLHKCCAGDQLYTAHKFYGLKAFIAEKYSQESGDPINSYFSVAVVRANKCASNGGPFSSLEDLRVSAAAGTLARWN